MTTDEAIIKASEKLLQILLEFRESHPSFNFWLRKRDIVRREGSEPGDNRLEKGYWFQGSHYIWIGFYKPGDWKNKTRTIGFVINFNDPEIPENYIEWVYNVPKPEYAEYHNRHEIFYKRLSEIFPNPTKIHDRKWRYYFPEQDIYKNLKSFLENNKSKIDDLLKALGLGEDFFIPEEKFQESLARTLSYRELLANPESHTNPATETFPTMTSLNTILYGTPGTGKTYNSIDLAISTATGKSLGHKSNKIEFDRLRKEGQIEFVTFHQNYTYEDFMVGIKPDIDNSILRFVPYKGIFYQLCKKARDNYEASHLTKKLQSFDDLVEEMLAKISNEQPLELNTLRGKPFWLTDYSDKTIYLRKSTGSEIHTLSISTLIELAEGKREIVSGLGTYYYPIIEYLNKNRKAVGTSEPLKKYVLVIDEINRANISKVFGELITLLEDDKRLGEENELRISLPNGEKDFAVPSNLYVIGTMNTADKSIALIDIALRRRFEFKGYYPIYEGYNKDAARLLEKVNEKIYSLKNSSDYLIGHAYFMNSNSIELTLRNKVIPLIMEYFSGKINLVSDIFKDTDWTVSYNSKSYSWDISTKA